MKICTTDHLQVADLEETVKDLLHHPVTEILLVRIVAHVLKRQHGN